MFVAKWYTRASRVRIVIAKFDGRWKLPGGPYPIPELVALVAGILITLFLLPRLGQPLLTAAVGVSATVIAVGAMRKMPYSPVPFGTRLHRIMRLYTHPASTSTTDRDPAAGTTSTVRAPVEILDNAAAVEPVYTATATGHHRRPAPAPQHHPEPEGWTDLFGHHPSPAADLFG